MLRRRIFKGCRGLSHGELGFGAGVMSSLTADERVQRDVPSFLLWFQPWFVAPFAERARACCKKKDLKVRTKRQIGDERVLDPYAL